MTDHVIERLEKRREDAYGRLAGAQRRLSEARSRVVRHDGQVNPLSVRQTAEYQIAAEELKKFADAAEAALAHARKDLDRRKAECACVEKLTFEAAKLDNEADKLRQKLLELEAQAAERRTEAALHQRRADYTAQELDASRAQVEAARAAKDEENRRFRRNEPLPEMPAYLEGLAT